MNVNELITLISQYDKDDLEEINYLLSDADGGRAGKAYNLITYLFDNYELDRIQVLYNLYQHLKNYEVIR